MFTHHFTTSNTRFSEGLAPVFKRERSRELAGYLGKNGQVQIPFEFDRADHFSQGLARIKAKGRFGFIDTTGRIVIPPQFDSVEPFENGLAWIMAGNEFGYIDRSGNIAFLG